MLGISHYLCCCCRVRLKEAEEEAFHRVDMEKRIKNLLSLKNNIESNKVCFRTKYYPKFLLVKLILTLGPVVQNSLTGAKLWIMVKRRRLPIQFADVDHLLKCKIEITLILG